MSFQPVDGVLETVLKVAKVDENAASELIRYTLYEALGDQIELARPRLEQDGRQMMAKRAAQARSYLLRSTVGKAQNDDSADLQVTDGLAVIDSFVNKGLFGTVLSIFNEKHPRDQGGHWVHVGGPSDNQEGTPGTPPSGGAVDARALFTRIGGAAAGDRASRYKANDQSQNADNWNRPGDFGDRQAYRRLNLTGQALSAMSVDGSTGSAVGTAAQIIGNVGPEAERVLAPGLRRTAYRYRGTEKSPDKTLVTEVAQAQDFAMALAGEDPQHSVADTKEALASDFGPPTQKEAKTPASGVAANYLRPIYSKMTRDQYELAVRGDVAAAGLMRDIPDEELTKISIAAGELPPSQGVIIDADGDLVSQAQGYNGDHYLPFDLKNLKSLQGGQYVRTRAAGGPTSEDIYTGLLSGARQVQVISNSGVFTLEFDPDVRGGRRYTDKAARMIGRYSKLLEAIDGGKLYDEDVDADKRRELRQRAYEQTGWNPSEGSKRYGELLDEARLKGSFNQEDEDTRFKAAIAQVNDEEKKSSGNPRHQAMSQPQYEQAVADVVRAGNADAASKRVRRMILDGQGYAKALLTLKQEFPFYIRTVRYETLPEFSEGRKIPLPPALKPAPFASDQGYTKPGQTNAERTLSRDKEGHVNDGRLVPTRDRRGASTETRTNADGTTTSVSHRPGATSGARTLIPAVKDEQGVVAPTEGDTLTFTEMIKAQPHWKSQLQRALDYVAPAFLALKNASTTSDSEMPLFDTEEQKSDEADVFGDGTNMGYAQYIYAKKAAGGGDISSWLLDDPSTTLAMRNKFVNGFIDLRKILTEGGKGGQEIKEKRSPEFDKLVDRIQTIVSLREPFAPIPEGDSYITTVPDNKNPLPPAIPTMVRRGNRLANYTKYLSEAQATNPRLTKAIETFSAAPDTAPGVINDQLEVLRKKMDDPSHSHDDEMEIKKELGALQTAWAFVHARAIAQVVDESDPKASAPQGPPKASAPAAEAPEGEAVSREVPPVTSLGGGAGSTREAPVRKAHQRSRLVFHHASEEFSQEVRKAFKM